MNGELVHEHRDDGRSIAITPRGLAALLEPAGVLPHARISGNIVAQESWLDARDFYQNDTQLRLDEVIYADSADGTATIHIFRAAVGRCPERPQVKQFPIRTATKTRVCHLCSDTIEIVTILWETTVSRLTEI